MDESDNANDLQGAFAFLQRTILDGLTHGFFECTVSAKLLPERKRQLIIISGKSYHFTITEEELRR